MEFFHKIPPNPQFPTLPTILLSTSPESNYVDTIGNVISSDISYEDNVVTVFFSGRGNSGHKFTVNNKLTKIEDIDIAVLSAIVDFIISQKERKTFSAWCLESVVTWEIVCRYIPDEDQQDG